MILRVLAHKVNVNGQSVMKDQSPLIFTIMDDRYGQVSPFNGQEMNSTVFCNGTLSVVTGEDGRVEKTEGDGKVLYNHHTLEPNGIDK